LVGKCEGKRLYGRSSRKWENNFKTNPKEIGYDGDGLDFFAYEWKSSINFEFHKWGVS
jgi:hypothetical protein